ncbi:hypothetical protein MSG28_004661 [Choristoneura fumiferana]|uniref:Uncharacterized protein n=1 Tax=Choristoneura fumiferana TaxID=7141 RepID=A0ACC0K749_CHOFU|nr:hypothetical protein MSG28_004661 [Choristoneura fumiferana]
MASPSPKSPEQSEKNKQYDRQLRLWGDHGQIALEKGHICLINATALGTEILKSIVLPGVGAITIVDDCTVSEEDIGSNFFLETSSKGLNRGSETLRLILELNPAVQGHAVQEPTGQILQENPDFFKSFTVVIATALGEKTIKELSQHLWDINVTFVLGRSVGFLGSFRIQIKEHAIIESHPDNEQPDLRLDVPFPALSQYLDSIDIETLDLKDHGHIPWIVIIYKAVMKWQKIQNDNRWPMSRKEKNEVRDLIREFIRKDENGIPINEENFEEALRAVTTALCPTFLPVKIQDLIYCSAATNLTKESSPFWIMCSALRGFIEAEGKGKLPLRGVLPDMTASTEHYVKLQNIYRAQAAFEAEAVYRKVQEIINQLHCDCISEADVKLFCRHAHNLHLVRGSSIASEYQSGPVASYIARHLEEPDVMMVHYILLRASEMFRSEHSRAPGDWEPEGDIAILKACVSKLLTDVSCPPFPKDDHVHEMCRYGGAEIHSVSAFLGGCIAQEAIKIITKQYKPVNNLFVYDGASTNTATFTF